MESEFYDQKSKMDWHPEDVAEVPLEKQQAWNRLEEQIENISDGLGRGIDAGIKQTVIALNANEIATSQSCSGHFNESGETDSAPWVEIYAPEPENWQADEQIRERWRAENLEQKAKLADLLKQFYSGRAANPAVDLEFVDVGIFGGFRVQSKGISMIENLPAESKLAAINEYRDEMRKFSEFLKDKFFQKNN